MYVGWYVYIYIYIICSLYHHHNTTLTQYHGKNTKRIQFDVSSSGMTTPYDQMSKEGHQIQIA